MQPRQAPHSRCDSCGEPIHYGQPAVSFCRNTEQRDAAGASSFDQVTVMESQPVLTLCASCGDNFCAPDIAQLLRTELKRRLTCRN